MTIQVAEKPNSRQLGFNPPSLITEWTCEGEFDQNTAANLILAATPQVMTHPDGILHRANCNVREEGHRLYSATVPYAPFQLVGAMPGVASPGVLGTVTWDFDTTGGTIHVTHSKATTNKYAIAGLTAPDFKGLIGVNGDNVEGVDRVIPALTISVRFNHPAGIMTLSRVKQIANVTGIINSQPFLSFAPGEVLFLGAIGSDGSSAPADVLYKFAMSANLTGQSIGDIASIAKAGWDYVWVVYQDTTSAAGGVTYPVKKPQFAYVERIYDTADLATVLGFG